MNEEKKYSAAPSTEPGKTRMDEQKKFLLVQFEQSRMNGIFDIDVVPATWVFCDWETKECFTKYPPPPYSKKICGMLQSRVREKRPPLQSWPQWAICVKGSAPTYIAALHRLEKLKTEKYAFTTDAEEDPKNKVDSIVAQCRRKSLNELFDVPSLGNDDDDGDNYLPSEETSWNSSKSSSAAREAKGSRIPKQGRSKSFAHKKSAKQGGCRRISSSEASDESLQKDRETQYENVKTAAKKTLYHDRNNNGGTDDQSDRAMQGVEPLSTKPGGSCVTQKEVCSRSDVFEELKRKEVSYSPDTMFLLSVLKRFSIDIRNNTAAINALHDALVGNGSVDPRKTTIESFKIEHDLQLPFTILQNYEVFEQRLKNDSQFKEDLMAPLRHLLDRSNNVTKSCTTIFRTFFTRQVMANFTAKKQVGGKVMIRNTSFGACVIAALTKFHTRTDGTYITTDEVLRCCGKAIANSKDWDGRRRGQTEAQS